MGLSLPDRSPRKFPRKRLNEQRRPHIGHRGFVNQSLKLSLMPTLSRCERYRLLNANNHLEFGAARRNSTLGDSLNTQPSGFQLGPFTLTSVNGAGVYQGTITGGASNAYLGFNFTVTGFVNGANNITAKCTASTATALTLSATTTVETHSGSAAFQCVVQDGINHSGTRPDGDTTYISDATAGHISDFAHEALTLTGTIHGVMHVSYVKKDDAGTRLFRQVCLSGSTVETNGVDLSATNTYLYYFDPLDVNPDTSTAFTPITYNNATFGCKEVS
jgi:hypothetical protein